MSPTAVQTAITAWQEKQINGTQLLRRLASCDAWIVPVSESAAAEMLSTHAAARLMISRDAAGVGRLYLFSDAAAWQTFRRAAGDGPAAGQHFLTTTGSWIFRLPLDQVDFVEIDPGSPWHINYTREQFPRLRALAEAVEIERTLLALRGGEAPTGAAAQVRDYAHYRLAVISQGGRTALALAPDSQGRALAAIFTAADNFDAFVDERRPSLAEGQLLSLELPGERLFRQLSGMPLDGLVFNCCGPAPAVAFAPAFAEVVLEA